MSRVTRKALESQLYTLNMVLKRPTERYTTTDAGPNRFNIGHIHLHHDSSGYSVVATESENGAVYVLASAMTATEAYYLIRGMITGVALRNRVQETNDLFHDSDLSTTDFPLYNNLL